MATRTKPARKRVSKRPKERREDLLDAAAKVFAKRGIDDATIEAITAAASVAKGTFYLYFRSKDDVVAGLKQRFLSGWIQGMSDLPKATTHGDWWSICDILIERMVDWMLGHGDLVEVLTRDLTRAEGKDILDFEATMLLALASGLEEGARAGAYQVSDPLLMATLLHHAVSGTVQHAIRNSPPGLTRDRIVAAAQELLRKALAKPS